VACACACSFHDDGEAAKRIAYRFHPDDFIFVRLTSQAFQQAARATQDPDIVALVDGMKIERNEAHVGLVFERVPGELGPLLSAVGEQLVASFGGAYISFGADGGFFIRHSGGGYASSGSIGFEGDDDYDSPSINPAELSAPFSFEKRMTAREGMINELLGGSEDAALKEQLLAERFIAIVALDPEAYAQVNERVDLVERLGVTANNDQGMGTIAAAMAQIEGLINPDNLRERWAAMPVTAQSKLMEQFDTVDRRQFEGCLGISVRRPKGP
jgi:hypothetical protein